MKKKLHAVYRKHRFSASIASIVLAFACSVVTLVWSGEQSVQPTDMHIVVLRSDGQTTTVPSRAKTVGEFIEKLNIDVSAYDVIEPAKDNQITSDNFAVQITRAKSYVVYDGAKPYPSISAHEAPRLVAEAAGLDLKPADTVTFVDELPDSSSYIGRKVQIIRAKQVLFTIYGKQEEFYTSSDTVGMLMAELKVTPAPGDELTASSDSRITAGMRLALNRKGIRVVTVEEPIPQEIQYVTDGSLAFGSSTVRDEGSLGKRTVTYELTVENDVEIARTKLSEVIVDQPKPKVVARGSMAAAIVGDKVSLMAAAGISPDDYAAVDYIIQKESGWRATASNSTSGAFGLCQALPGIKMASAGDDWQSNPVTQLRWCSGYAAARYGGWQGAYQRWLIQNWW